MEEKLGNVCATMAAAVAATLPGALGAVVSEVLRHGMSPLSTTDPVTVWNWNVALVWKRLSRRAPRSAKSEATSRGSLKTIWLWVPCPPEPTMISVIPVGDGLRLPSTGVNRW